MKYLILTFQVLARAKRSSGTGDDADAQGGLIVEPFPYGVQFLVTGVVDAIER